MQDFTIAWRFLLKRPTSTAIAVLTLGITIAISTIAIGAIDQAFWRAPDGERGGELVTIYNSRPSAPFYQTLSYPDYRDVRDRLSDRVDLAAFVRIGNTLGGGEWPTRVGGELVSGNYFAVLGARPFAGRLLNPDDDRSADPIIVLGHDLWRRRFAGNPSVVGTTLRLGGQDVTVVGVAPPGFHGPAWPSDYWLPLGMARHVFTSDLLSRSDAPIFQTVGRPKPGLRPAQIEGRIASIDTHASRDNWRLNAYPAVYLRFWPAYRSSVAQFLGVFAGLACCVLIIACANLAGLLLARAGERQRELALRQALGATRLHLVRRLAAESIILTMCGGATGAFFASWLAALMADVPLPVPAGLSVTLDLRLGAIVFVVSLAAAVLFTTLSAWKGLRTNPRSVLAASSGAIAAKAGAQHGLVIAQVALGCVMLTVAGLLVRSAWQVEQVDVGFRVEDGVLGRVALHDQAYSNVAGLAFYQRLQENLAEHPEVEAVALGWHVPTAAVRTTASFTIAESADVLQSRYNVVSSDYFRTLGIRVRAGREFDGRDGRDAEPVAIVNDALAARVNGDPIGKTLRLAGESAPRRIVGIVREIKYNGITEASQPYVYLPFAQAFRQDMYVHIRTRSAGAETLLRTGLRRLDPNLALSDVRTLGRQVDEARATPRASAVVSASAAAIAVLLALIGVYGVLMTSVDQRQRELAIRAALGATPSEIVGRVLWEGFALTFAGLALGIFASLQAGRFVAGQLFGVEPRDATVMVLVPLIVLLVSAIAWIAPARRAALVDPVAALRRP